MSSVVLMKAWAEPFLNDFRVLTLGDQQCCVRVPLALLCETTPVSKVDQEFIYTPADFLGWALKSGWQPSTLPIGVVYTFQDPVTRAIVEDERFVDNTELIVSNARMLMTVVGGDPVLIGCMNPGASSMVTQLEHLRFLAGDSRLSAVIWAPLERSLASTPLETRSSCTQHSARTGFQMRTLLQRRSCTPKPSSWQRLQPNSTALRSLEPGRSRFRIGLHAGIWRLPARPTQRWSRWKQLRYSLRGRRSVSPPQQL